MNIVNRHSGRPGCLIASGPSLRGFDFNRCSDSVTMCVNYMMGVYPDGDYGIYIDNTTYIDDPEYGRKIEAFHGQVFTPKEPAGRLSRELIRFERYFTVDKSEGKLRAVFEWPNINDNRITSAAGLHLLLTMGCNPIYLLGVDFALGPDGSHHGHWHPDELDETKIYTPVHLDKLRKRFEEVLTHCQANYPARIINVTPIVNGRPWSALSVDDIQDLKTFDLRKSA